MARTGKLKKEKGRRKKEEVERSAPASWNYPVAAAAFTPPPFPLFHLFPRAKRANPPPPAATSSFFLFSMTRRQLRAHDLKQIADHETLAGIDEAGRGALAGPVVAAAVLVTREFLESPWTRKNATRINDSKQLTPAQRETLHADLAAHARAGRLRLAHASATVDEIEHHNILGATKLAMRRAMQQLHPPAAFAPARPADPELFPTATEPHPHSATPPSAAKPLLTSPSALQPFSPSALSSVSCRILIDGLPLKNFPYPHTAIVHGDARSLCIAMASIIAKVTRDHLMTALDAEYPAYGFAHHKGYGTEEHRAALLRHGATPQHRKIFLRKLLDTRVDPAQIDFLVGVFPEKEKT